MIEWLGLGLLVVVTGKILYTFHLDLDYEGYRTDINNWIQEHILKWL